jgi:hypothetical protein
VSEWINLAFSIVISVATLYVLFKTYHLEKKKAKQENFEYKYQIYKDIKEYILTIVSNATTTPREMVTMHFKTDDASIFFDQEIVQYIKEIYEKSNRLQYISKIIDRNCSGNLKSTNYTELVDEQSQIVTWFGDQIATCKVIFGKKLRID